MEPLAGVRKVKERHPTLLLLLAVEMLVTHVAEVTIDPFVRGPLVNEIVVLDAAIQSSPFPSQQEMLLDDHADGRHAGLGNKHP